MYVDSKPKATFGETSGWVTPSPQPVGAMVRPPMVRGDTSSSSLSGMEQSVPSFRNFVKQTPSVQQKPLPPPPSIPSRVSSNSPPRSRTTSRYSGRRSSSVYSRTASQWGSDVSSWRSADFADEPIPPLPTLLPLAYSASTPQLVERQPTPPLLKARTYSPLIVTPSPTVSRVSSPSPPPQHKPSILLPTPTVSVQVPEKNLRTVTLEQARLEVHSPGAVHLLPEELRAQIVKKSKSHEPIRLDSGDIIAGSGLPQHQHPPTLVDHQGRRRTLHLSPEQYVNEYQFPTTQGPGPRSGLQEEHTEYAQSSAAHPRKVSRNEAVHVLGTDNMEESRGRTRHRGPRTTDYEHYLPTPLTEAGDNCEKNNKKPQNNVRDYHLSPVDQYRGLASSPEYYHTDSDESIKYHMKMVPRPLFQTKPAAERSPTGDSPQSNDYTSPYRLSEWNGRIRDSSSDSNGSSRGPNPFDFAPGSTHKRRSTSGSIPISPPMGTSPFSMAQSPEKPRFVQPKARKSKGGDEDRHVSAFYPHIAPRKPTKSSNKRNRAGVRTPPIPLLSADDIAQRLKTPNRSPASSARRMKWPSSASRRDEYRSGSNASSERMRAPLHERIAKGAAKYADLLTKPSELPERRDYRTSKITRVIAGSPHLAPSPVKSTPTRVHLGWSHSAKNSYDTSRSLVASPKWFQGRPDSPSVTHVTHIAAPARPLDERADGLKELEMSSRKGSIFGGVLEIWKDNKAERRREELKKIIKVIPQEVGTPPAVNRRSSTFGWM